MNISTFTKLLSISFLFASCANNQQNNPVDSQNTYQSKQQSYPSYNTYTPSQSNSYNSYSTTQDYETNTFDNETNDDNYTIPNQDLEYYGLDVKVPQPSSKSVDDFDPIEWRREQDRKLNELSNRWDNLDRIYANPSKGMEEINRMMAEQAIEQRRKELLAEPPSYAPNPYYSTGPNTEVIQVDGYNRSNGTYVSPYYRTAPNSTKADNFSTYPNVNPYTGAVGTKRY